MSPNFAGVIADARALWRSERTLLLPLAGVFFCLPILAMVLLLAGANLPEKGTSEQLVTALTAFYEANLLFFVAMNIAIDFGSFAALNLFLQGGGRTLGEVLGLTVRRFMPFVAMAIVVRFVLGLGLSLFVLPGLFIAARTWLAGPAYAAAPERGVGAAFREGWRRSAGFAGLLILGVAAAPFFVSALAVLVSAALLGAIGVLVGSPDVLSVFAYLCIGAIGGLTWAALAVLRVALYRAMEPRQGI